MRLVLVPLGLVLAIGCRAPTEDTGPDPLLIDADGDGTPAVSSVN